MDPRVKPENDAGGEVRPVGNITATPAARNDTTFSVMPWLDHGIHAVAVPFGELLREAADRHGFSGQARE